MSEILNAKITKTKLGIEDHGILTFGLCLEISGGSDRGHGIRRYLSDKPHIASWCVIDDEIFEDYEECDIMKNLVKTSFYDEN